MAVSMDDWIAGQKPKHDPRRQIQAAGLVDDLRRGRAAGLSLAKLVAWLELHDIYTTEATVKAVIGAGH